MLTRRPALSLDGKWEFVADPARRLPPGGLPAGIPIDVPGAWEAQLAEPYRIIHAWYRRRFTIPDWWRAGALVVRFGAAMARATVWLDGRPLGANEDGYLPFEVEAGPPRPGEHELVVSVENPLNAVADYPAFRPGVLEALPALDGRPVASLPLGKQTWYTSTSGLLGSVTIELAPDPRFVALVVLPDLAGGRALVRWRTAGSAVADGEPSGDPARIAIEVTAPSGRVVARSNADAQAGSTAIEIPDPEPWDIWQPALYRLDARLTTDRVGTVVAGDGAAGPAVDEVGVVFGMRSIAVRDGAILLNGRPIYVRGALDQDFWPVGRSSPPSRAALEEQVRLAREMGLNLLRCHLKVPDPAYLDVADEAGLLVWCELPNWNRFDAAAGALGRRMLARMVETMGSHPSIVAWTVINEDWGTDLRHEARHRRWLRGTVDGLKVLDPSRLVVDNSACETGEAPNFHLRTDLADFHAYRSMPDGLPRWRALIEDFARRPAWLWSPDGDAAPTGNEALVLSEFGGWGLPRPSAVGASAAGEPWWWTTGETFRRPAGIERRFLEQGLDRIWPDLDALAEATQWQQFNGLAAQIRELRRHPSIRGYVLTELSDAFWEPNGLLDVGRGRKVFHDRLGEINAQDVLIVDVPRNDVWSGEPVRASVTLSSFPDRPVAEPAGAGRLAWRLELANGASSSGSATFERWPHSDATVIGELSLEVPGVDEIVSAQLIVTATESGGRAAVSRTAVVVVPRTLRTSTRPLQARVIDPLDRWSIASRLAGLGHRVVAAGTERWDGTDLLVTAQLDREALEIADHGGTVLVLARARDAIPAGLGLARPMAVQRRGPGDGTSTGERPWDGDWSSVFAWSLPGFIPGLPDGGLLGEVHVEIFPDHVLTGLDVASRQDGVRAGMFSGWVHSPAGLAAQFDQGAGQVVITTLRLAPEDGPVATAVLELLTQTRAGARIA